MLQKAEFRPFKIFGVYLTLILMSCQSNVSNIDKHILNLEGKILRDETNGEYFNSFFDYFKQDTLFQFQRNIIPFVYKWEYVQINAKGDLVDTMLMSTDKALLKPKDWTLKLPIKVENIQDTVSLSYSTAEEIFDVINKEYFVKVNGKWFYDSKLSELKNERRN